MKSNHSDRIIERLSLKYNLPKKVIRAVLSSQYEFLKISISEGEFGKFETFASIRLRFFGIWKVHRKKLERITSLYEAKLKRKQEEDESICNQE